MHQIFKYPLDFDSYGIAKVELPKTAEVLTVRLQSSPFGRGVMIYAKVDPELRREEITFKMVPTGDIAPQNAQYVGTIETESGLVFHIFKRVGI